MGFIAWIIFGALAGWIASKIAGTDERMGALANIVVGIIGASIGGYLYSVFTGETVQGFNIPNLLVAIVGAVIFLGVLKLVTGMAGKK
jgi:uncharacterized membrane protein YeaQ/YmgE (transglycosylase-associated protein family)